MKSYELQTYQKEVFIDITRNIRDAVARSGISEGIAVVHCPHTTAGILIMENSDPTVREDTIKAFNKMIPEEEFKHDNFVAHFKAAMAGNSVSLPIENGKLKLGTWQAVYFCEFDGPRPRRNYYVTIGKCE
ncbi:hypothetical protein CE91St36_02000 [Christensenellaceae bacterium]|nr:hypothetical protein CE91St36_02000 [Christensenellaceae bacterium]BDF60051.1 hypothetical protein CE91St37_02010 [Christensenellaceae bacterium]